MRLMACVLLLAACTGEIASQEETGLVTRTVVHLNADGTQTVHSDRVSVAEQQAEVAEQARIAADPARALERRDRTAQAAPQNLCWQGGVYLFDKGNFEGNYICFSGDGVVDLSQYCRAYVYIGLIPRCIGTWAGAIGSSISGLHEVSYISLPDLLFWEFALRFTRSPYPKNAQQLHLNFHEWMGPVTWNYMACSWSPPAIANDPAGEPPSNEAVTQTIVELHSDGTQTVRTRKIVQDGSQVAAQDSGCAWTSVTLHDRDNYQGNSICISGDGIVDLTQFCRATIDVGGVPRCIGTWAGAIRSTWTGSYEAYASGMSDTLHCGEYLNPYVALAAPTPYNCTTAAQAVALHHMDAPRSWPDGQTCWETPH